MGITWTTYTKEENQLNAFYLRCLRKIMGYTWKDKVTNNAVLSKANTTTIYVMLRERRLRWLGHVSRMNKGRIPKDLLYDRLERGTRSKGRPQLRFKDSCKRDLLSTHIDINTWEDIVADQLSWRHAMNQGMQRAEEDRRAKHDLKRQKRKASSSYSTQISTFICTDCTKDCHSRIGLYSHRRYCSKKTGATHHLPRRTEANDDVMT